LNGTVSPFLDKLDAEGKRIKWRSEMKKF